MLCEVEVASLHWPCTNPSIPWNLRAALKVLLFVLFVSECSFPLKSSVQSIPEFSTLTLSAKCLSSLLSEAGYQAVPQSLSCSSKDDATPPSLRAVYQTKSGRRRGRWVKGVYSLTRGLCCSLCYTVSTYLAGVKVREMPAALPAVVLLFLYLPFRWFYSWIPLPLPPSLSQPL